MAAIKHTSLMFSDLSTLEEIPSEFIEPYLVKFFGYIIEAVGTGRKSVEEAKSELKGVGNFIGLFGGLHCRIAFNNEYNKINSLSEEDLKKMCMECCK